MVNGLGPALERHNKEQLTAVRLPGAQKSVRVVFQLQDLIPAAAGGMDGKIG